MLINATVHLDLYFQFDGLSRSMGPFLLDDLMQEQRVAGVWRQLHMWLAGYVFSDGDELNQRLDGLTPDAARAACASKYGLPDLSQYQQGQLNRRQRVTLSRVCELLASHLLGDLGILQLFNSDATRIMILVRRVIEWRAGWGGEWPNVQGLGLTAQEERVLRHVLTWRGPLERGEEGK